jgi:hypothetical protein
MEMAGESLKNEAASAEVQRIFHFWFKRKIRKHIINS